MEHQIHPLTGVDNIKFGDHIENVRQHFDYVPRSFKRTPLDPTPCDYFESDGIFSYYDKEGHLEAIEFTSPALPSINSLKLLGLSANEAVAALSRLDSDIVNETDGAISYKIGISIYAPLAKEDPAAPVESVLAFRSGYYT